MIIYIFTLGILFKELSSSNYVFANSLYFWAPDPLINRF